MGKRTSIYLSGDREAAVEATGKTLVELIDIALEAVEGEGRRPQAKARPMTQGPQGPLTPENCKHPKARRAKGLCMACGTYVGTS